MKKLCISLVISNSAIDKTLTAITTLMHNFIANFAKILDIYKHFAGNGVNEVGNPRNAISCIVSRCIRAALCPASPSLPFDTSRFPSALSKDLI